MYEDIEVVRDATFSCANIADSLDLQSDIVREGGIEILREVGKHDDARVQRDVARAFSCLSVSEDVKATIVQKDGLATLFQLAKSMDVASQRYATLAICNLSSGEHKGRIVEEGAIRPLMYLGEFLFFSYFKSRPAQYN